MSVVGFLKGWVFFSFDLLYMYDPHAEQWRSFSHFPLTSLFLGNNQLQQNPCLVRTPLLSILGCCGSPQVGICR